MSQFASKDDLIAAQAVRIAELESQLEAIGAGGVQSLRKQAAAPQSVQAAVPSAVCCAKCRLIVARNQVNFAGECYRCVSKPAAPAHPAEGVPAQAVTKVQQTAPKVIHLNIGPDAEDCDFKDLHDVTWCDHDATDGSIQYVRADLAATHPTQQGLDAQRWQIVHNRISGEYIAGRACFVVQIAPVPGASIMRGSVAEHFIRAVDFAAAQAKQGGV